MSQLCLVAPLGILLGVIGLSGCDVGPPSGQERADAATQAACRQRADQAYEQQIGGRSTARHRRSTPRIQPTTCPTTPTAACRNCSYTTGWSVTACATPERAPDAPRLLRPRRIEPTVAIIAPVDLASGVIPTGDAHSGWRIAPNGTCRRVNHPLKRQTGHFRPE